MEQRSAQERFDLLLRQLGGDVIGVDADGRIASATGDALARLEAYLGSDRDADQLPRRLDAWRLVQVRVADGPGRVEPFIVDRPGSRLRVRFLGDAEGCLLIVDELVLAARPEALIARGLTAREAEVVCVISEGHSNATTAERLGLSLRTVEKHLEHAYTKLGVRNRAAAMHLVLTAAVW